MPEANLLMGKMWKSEIARVLGTNYLNFQSPLGIDGLFREEILENGRGLHLLAVVSITPCTGNFYRFISIAKTLYREISVWEISNPDLAASLQRYGFTQTEEIFYGQKSSGLKWTRK